MSAIKNISKQNVIDEVYKQFTNAIASGEWKVGQKVPPERELVAMTGASRVSVRGALQRLATLGMVESRQGDGTFVCEPQGGEYMHVLLPMILASRPELDDLLEFRLIIEVEMARLAAQRRTDEHIRQMKESYLLLKACKDDNQQAFEYDFRFHTQISDATGNSLIRQVYSVLTDVFGTALCNIVKVMGSCNALYYHKNILDAIEQQDSEAAVHWMREHILDTIAAFKKTP